jgi:hypothetical protein
LNWLTDKKKKIIPPGSASLVPVAAAVAALSWSLPLHAMKIETQVRLRGLDRTLTITHDEPGQPNTLTLDFQEQRMVFRLETFNPSAGIVASSREFQDDNKIKRETANLFLDPLLMARFKRAPEWSAKGMGFLNSSEVHCPPESNAVLRYQQTHSPRVTLGNCLRLPFE